MQALLLYVFSSELESSLTIDNVRRSIHPSVCLSISHLVSARWRVNREVLGIVIFTTIRYHIEEETY